MTKRKSIYGVTDIIFFIFEGIRFAIVILIAYLYLSIYQPILKATKRSQNL